MSTDLTCPCGPNERCADCPRDTTKPLIDDTAVKHYSGCENTGPDGMGCNCGAYTAALLGAVMRGHISRDDLTGADRMCVDQMWSDLDD